MDDKPLNEIMEFDHVIRVHPDGTITDAEIHGPEGWYDGELSQGIDGRWELMTGYTGQHGSNGPGMHNSEFIGGRMEQDIRSNPGVYVALVCQYTYAQDEDDDWDYDAESYDEGWVVAYIHDAEPAEPDTDDLAWARDDLGLNATDDEVYEVAARRARERAGENIASTP